MKAKEKQHYWRQNMQVIGVLLSIWAIVSIGAGILFVEQLNAIHLGGLPLGFWMAQQGAIFIFVLIIFAYARIMDRIDASHHATDDDEPEASASNTE